jgi:hypothetical protein
MPEVREQPEVAGQATRAAVSFRESEALSDNHAGMGIHLRLGKPQHLR